MAKKSSIDTIANILTEGSFKIVPMNRNRLVDKNGLPLEQWKISHYGLTGATVSENRPILKRGQLLQCIDGYHNDGTIRVMVDKRTDFMLGNRPKNSIDVILENLEEDNPSKQALEAVMKEAEAKELQKKIDRVNKICSFHERLTSLVKQNFVIGRSAGGIEREINEDFPFFGEPIALKILNPLRLKSPKINSKTWDLEGIYYDFGEPDKSNVLIPSNNLLPLVHNDNNLYDNTLWTGMSAIWPILSIAQANSYINDEDIPESAKSMWAKFGFVYVGDKNADSMDKFEKNAKIGTLFYHNNPNLDAKIFDLKSDLRELTDVRMSNMKAMCINFGFPMFLLFEDSANFATAKEVMQGFKAGVLERDRTWLRNFLERYWYDPILADHLGITDLKDLLKEKIKIKAAFDDVNFETRRDIAEVDIELKNAGVMLPIDIAKDCELAPEIIERLEKFSADEQVALQMEKQRKEVEAIGKVPAGASGAKKPVSSTNTPVKKKKTGV